MSLLSIRSLHGKLLLVLIPVVLIIALIMVGLFSFLSIERFEKELQSKEQALLISVSQVMAEPLWSYQYEALNQLVLAVMTDPDVLRVRVFDEGNNDVLTVGEIPDNERVDQLQQVILYQNAHIQQYAGTLEISFGRQRLETLLLQRVLQELLLICLMTLGILACVLIISRYIIRQPLAELLSAMSQSKSTGRLKPVHWDSDDEIGQIIHEYNLLQESLSAKDDELRVSRARHHALYHNTPALMFSIGCDARVRDVSDYFCQELLLSPDRVIGTLFWHYLSGENSEQVKAQIEQAQQQEKIVRDLKAGFSQPSGEIDVLITAVPEYDEEHRYSGHLMVLSDITQLNQAYQVIERQANFDTLTGLANRNFFQRKIDKLFAEKTSVKLSLLFIDLDGFKQVNDTLGHLIGDQLLIAVAKRMTGVVPEPAIVARLGGDEFAVLIDDSGQSQDLDLLSTDILLQLATPFKINRHDVRISGSIGIACSPMHAANPTELLQYADIAMYQAKNSGKNAHCFYQALGSEATNSVQG